MKYNDYSSRKFINSTHMNNMSARNERRTEERNHLSMLLSYANSTRNPIYLSLNRDEKYEIIMGYEDNNHWGDVSEWALSDFDGTFDEHLTELSKIGHVKFIEYAARLRERNLNVLL